MRPKMKLLSDELLKRIVEEATGLLVKKGVNLNHDGLTKQLADNGCRVDASTKRVYFTEEIIQKSIESAPSQVKLWDLTGDNSWDLSGDRVHFTPGSAAIKTLDHNADSMRLANVDDMLRYSRMVGQLPHISYPSTAMVPSDVPHAIGDSIRLFTLLRATNLPIVTGAFTVDGFEVMKDLQLAVRGTEATLKEKPFTIFSCCPSSPLKWSRETADNTMRCAQLGIPVEFISMPLPGLVAPITLVGSLIQHTAETLSGVVISQSSRAGAPVLYGGSPGSFDMRSMTAAIGTLEAQMMDCAYAQIGKHFGLPTQAYIGLSDSKYLDAQAGHETGTGLYLAALAGINSLSGPGMLFNESCLSLEKLIMDNELCGMTKRLVAGIEPKEDFPCEGLFDELLENHELLSADHTLKYYRDEHYMPGPTIDRTPESDSPGNQPSLADRANAQLQKLLDGYQPPNVLSTEQLKDLDEVMTAAAGGKDLVEQIAKGLG